mgnify:CR=1 FL=1
MTAELEWKPAPGKFELIRALAAMATPRARRGAEALAMLADGGGRQAAHPGHGRQADRIAGDKPASTDPQNGGAPKGPGLGLLQDERQANGINGRKYQQEEAGPYRDRKSTRLNSSH